MKKMKYIVFIILLLWSTPVFAATKCVTCGDSLPFPVTIPNFVSKLILLAQIAVPIMIIIGAMIRYFKVVGSNDEKAAKEANSSFVRSLITGVAIFLVVVIVKVVFNLAGDNTSSSLNCVSCFISGENSCGKKVACPDREELNPSSDKSTIHDSSSGYENGGGSKSF